MENLKITQGDKLQMLNYGEPVREFIVLETEFIEGKTNAYLYDIAIGDQEKNPQWHYLHTNEQIQWKIIKMTEKK